MHWLVAMLVGAVVAWAAKRRNAPDDLGHARWIAGICAALFPYTDIVWKMMGAGAYAHFHKGVFWSLPLVPLYAFLLAVLFGRMTRQPWGRYFAVTAFAMFATVLLALLTDNGIFPLALMVHVRVGLGVLHPFDTFVLALMVSTLTLAAWFSMWKRDIARAGLAVVVVYIAFVSYQSWMAHSFGRDYARVMVLGKDVNISSLPQPLSPFNWRVIVEERSGRMHDTLINVWRKDVLEVDDASKRARRIDALYRPPEKAVWRVYRKYGSPDMNDTDQRRIYGAWSAWQRTPFDWMGRYAVFDEMILPPAGHDVRGICVQFKDLRYEGAREDAAGVVVVCPGVGGKARIFRPFRNGWVELVPVV